MTTEPRLSAVRGSRSPGLAWRLPFALIVALRYFKSTRKDAFVTFLSGVAAGGLALGVAALILSVAALSGFQEHLIATVLDRSAHLEIELPAGADGAEALRDKVATVEGVEAVQAVLRGKGWAVVPGRGIQQVEIIGYRGSVPASFADSAGKDQGLYISSVLAARWGLSPGDAFDLVSPRPTLTPFGGPQPRLRSARLSGIYNGAPAPGEIERVAVPLEMAESLLGRASHRLEVDTGGFAAADDVARRLEKALPAGPVIRTWRELNRPLFFVLRLEKALMFVAVFLIVVVAAFALVADLALIIANKRPEIGILSAMGATPRVLRRIFLVLGLALCAVGILAGAVLGISGAWVLDRYEMLPVPSGTLFLSYVPFEVRAVDLGLIIACTALIGLGASLYAATRAGGVNAQSALQG